MSENDGLKPENLQSSLLLLFLTISTMQWFPRQDLSGRTLSTPQQTLPRSLFGLSGHGRGVCPQRA